MRQHVEGDLVRIHFFGDRLAPDNLADLAFQFFQRLGAEAVDGEVEIGEAELDQGHLAAGGEIGLNAAGEAGDGDTDAVDLDLRVGGHELVDQLARGFGAEAGGGEVVVVEGDLDRRIERERGEAGFGGAGEKRGRGEAGHHRAAIDHGGHSFAAAMRLAS